MTTFNFEAYKNDVTRKAAVAKRGVAELYRDGKPVFTPESHKMGMDHALAPLQQAVAEAVEHAQSAQAEAKKLEALQHADPLSALSTEELQRIAAARELARDEITQLLPEQLSARLTAVAGSGDRVSQVLHLLYARPLVQASDDSRLHQQLGAIDEVVYGAQRAKAVKAVEQAQTLRKEAAELSYFAGDTLSEIDGSKQAAYEQRRAEYAAAF